MNNDQRAARRQMLVLGLLVALSWAFNFATAAVLYFVVETEDAAGIWLVVNSILCVAFGMATLIHVTSPGYIKPCLLERAFGLRDEDGRLS